MEPETESHPMETIEEEETQVPHDESAEEDEEGDLGNMGALGDMLASAFGGGGSESGLDDGSLIQSFLDEMYDEDDVTTEDLPPPPPMTREELTMWVLSRYRDAETKYYPEEVKAQVRLLQLVFYVSDEDTGAGSRLQRLAREIWKA